MSMWFIGILFKKVENAESVNIDLTYDIQSFTDTVYRQANNINMLKDGMKIEATHVKKKQLHQYLPPELIQKKKRSIAELNRSSNGGSSKRISLDSSHLDSSTNTDSGTPICSPASKPLKPTSETDEGASPPKPLFVESSPVSASEAPEAVQGSKPSVKPSKPPSPPPVAAVLPNAASSPKEESNGAADDSVNGASIKRPHSPTQEELSKRHKDEAVSNDDATFKEPYPPSDVCSEGMNVNTASKAKPIPTLDTSRTQRLPSMELPDASSPLPASNSCRVVKNSIKLALNRHNITPQKPAVFEAPPPTETPPASVATVTAEKGMSIPVIGSKHVSKLGAPPVGSSIPTLVSRSTDPLNGSSSKRPHSPSMEEQAKRLKETEKARIHIA
ncbi:hypothetical protein NQD34_011114 [Periophthalmus magnuspinnatus]|nr:hypothetical protein NQD34_011114 [Periophthalmus magnuspinnatus]